MATKGFDPLENAKVVPAAPPPPPLPNATPAVADAEMEKKRHAREGTPAVYEQPKPVQVPPAKPVAAQPAVDRFRVTNDRVINVRGSLTKLAKGSIVSERTHDLNLLRQHQVTLEPIT